MLRKQTWLRAALWVYAIASIAFFLIVGLEWVARG